MIVPRKLLHRPRITLGQILVSVAVSAPPIALVMGSVRDESVSTGGIVLVGLLCLALVLFFEVFFWWFLVPLISPLHRSLGRPSWFAVELLIDREGITWVEPPPEIVEDRPDRSRDAEIQFLD